LKLEDLIGSKVWIKPRGLPEASGYITAIPKRVNLETIDLSITVSTFEVTLASGDVVETSGFNITVIENAEYDRVSIGRQRSPQPAGIRNFR
jgi:hypothetical protein